MTVNFDVAKAEVHRLSKELHGGQYAPNSSEYEYHRQGDAAGRSTIFNEYGPWDNFVDACGLAMGPRKFYTLASRQRGASILAMRKADDEDAESHMNAVVRKTNHLPNEYKRALEEAHAPMGLLCFDEPRLDVCWIDGREVERLAWMVR